MKVSANKGKYFSLKRDKQADITMDMHGFFEDASPRVKDRRMVKIEIIWNFYTCFGRTPFWGC